MKNYLKLGIVMLGMLSICSTTLAGGSFYLQNSVNRGEDITLRWDMSWIEDVKNISGVKCVGYGSDELYIQIGTSNGNPIYKKWNELGSLRISSKTSFPTDIKHISAETKELTVGIECFDENGNGVHKDSGNVKIVDDMKLTNLDLSSKVEKDGIIVNAKIKFTGDLPENVGFYADSNINSSYCKAGVKLLSPGVAATNCKIKMDMDYVKAGTYNLRVKITGIGSRTSKVTIENNNNKPEVKKTNNKPEVKKTNPSNLSPKLKNRFDTVVKGLKTKVDSKYKSLESRITHFEKLIYQLEKLANIKPKYKDLISHISVRLEKVIEGYKNEIKAREDVDGLDDILNLLQ